MSSFTPNFDDIDLSQLSLDEQKRLVELAAHGKNRRMEGIRLFRPLPHQNRIFHSPARELIVRGGVRSGKTTSASAKVVSEALGIPITDAYGKQCPMWFPNHKGLKIWIIAYDEKHLASTIYRVLFNKAMGAKFRIIRDPITKEWRPFHPWEEWDAENEHRSKEAPPLIPRRVIKPKSFAWTKKARNVWSRFELWNGTVIEGYTAKADPKKGDPVHIIWINEDLYYADYYPELQSRLADFGGHIIWDAFPLNGNEALVDVSDRARKCAHQANPAVEEIVLRFSDNPFFDAQVKRDMLAGWSPEEVAARDRGEFSTGAIRMYPTFAPDVHATPCITLEQDDAIDKLIRENNNQIPNDWCRDLILDPGLTLPGALVCAVPPPELGIPCGVVESEIILEGADCVDMTLAIRPLVEGKTFRRFIIDLHGGKIGTVSEGGKQWHVYYGEQFEKLGLRCQETGSQFQFSTDLASQGQFELVRQALRVKPLNGKSRPWLRYIREACNNFERQMLAYRKQLSSDVITDKPSNRQNMPLCDDIRYWVCSQPEWVFPEPPHKAHSVVLSFFQSPEWQGHATKRDTSIRCGLQYAAN